MKKVLTFTAAALSAIAIFFLARNFMSGDGLVDAATKAASDTAGAVANTAKKASVGTADIAKGVAAGAVGTINAAKDVAGGVVDASGNVVNAFGDAIGSFFSWALPNGQEINIPEGGSEEKFLKKLKAGNFQAEEHYMFDRVYFDSGSSHINDASQDQIETVAQILKAYSDVRIVLRGHTDSSGNAEANKKLSLERADALKAALVQHGTREQRIRTLGMGSVEPIASNDTDEGKRHNRRIDISFVR